MRYVLAVCFEDDAKAYEALTTLKELDGQDQVELTGAAVVVRQEDGRVVVKDSVGDTGLVGTATGGIIGLLIGVLGGPLGVLVGGATGLLVGSLFDLDDDEETTTVLSAVSRSVRVDHTALLAEVEEPSPDVIDAAMGGLGGTVTRETVDAVNSEIAAAETAQRKAKKQARRHLREERQAQRSADVHAKIAALKAKLHHRKPTSDDRKTASRTAAR